MLENRSTQAEIMDDLSCEGEVVNQTLRELNTINRLLGGNHLSIQGLDELSREKEQVLTVADLGCGGGDILIRMAEWARKKGKKMKFVGIDANPFIIEYATKRCADYPEISFQALNVFEEAFANQSFDIIH
ncbi:MAG: methyltransferase domain-containing protein, partial [Bacteroidota bacterium]